MKNNGKRTCIQMTKLLFIGILMIALFVLAFMHTFIPPDAKLVSTVHETSGLSVIGDSPRKPLIPTTSQDSKARTKSVTSLHSPLTSAASDQKTTKITENLDPGKNFTAVMLLTYMRSGSSLTGDILQQPDDTFYVFEPLKHATKLCKQKRSITFLNGTVMPFGTYNLHDVYFNTLMGWFTCNLTRIYAEGLLDGALVFGNKFKPYHMCLNRFGGFDKISALTGMFLQNTLQSEPLKSCMNLLQKTCLSSKYRIIKTIRARMPLAEEIMMSLENSKVIHLVRDPRATLESWINMKGIRMCSNGMKSCTKQHCGNVIKDTSLKEIISLSSRKRIITIKYEDIATKPVQTSKNMYEFIEMDFTAQISDYVFNITLGDNKSGCDVCKQSFQIGKSEKSSETHVDSWKLTMLPENINKTQELCSDVIKHYNYEYFVALPEKRSHKDKHNEKVEEKKIRRKIKSRKV